MKKIRKYKTNRNLRDKYFTKKEVAGNLIQIVIKKLPDINLFLEPSAGNGSFSNQIENCVAFDISPKQENIIKKNFFQLTPNNFNCDNICCIGNPPFGRNSSLAIKFFNHASLFCKYIAFILPKTFRKVSIQNKLNDSFHIIYDEELPKNSFVFENKEIDVPCVFQIWERREEKRKKVIIKKTSKFFDFVDRDNCDLAVRRVGGRTGKVFIETKELSEQSNYFIKLNMDLEEFIKVVNSINFKEIINNTAGVRSLSKHEFILLMEERINNGDKM